MNLSGLALAFALDLPVSSAVVVVGAALVFVLQAVRKKGGR
jgi:hypothetical protein